MTGQTGSSEFPIPEGIEGFWQWDKMHCPRPQTALTEEIFLRGVSVGFTTAMDQLACPVGMQYQVINRYGFYAIVPQDLGDESMDQRIPRYQQTLEDIVPRLGDLWTNEWLPSILPGLEKAQKTDYAALDDSDLLLTLAEMTNDFTDRYIVHGKINFVLVPASQFADLYIDLFNPDDPTEPYQVLQGFPTRSVDAGRGLWALGRTIHNSPSLKKTFDETATEELPDALDKSEEGRKFHADLRTYLDEFGWRSDVFELSDKTWRENPTIPLNSLQGYSSLGDDADPELKHQEAVATREHLLAQARERLADQPEQLAKFNGLYDAAKAYLPLTEDHNYYIDQVGNAVMRLPFLELGRRLSDRGALAVEDDVFLLYTTEIEAGLQGTDQKSLVSERRAELDAWALVLPVPVIGEPPPPNDDPFGAGIGKMFGQPPEPSRDPDIITGIGASPGTVQGKAKVVHDLSEASKVEAGDILVCEMTMPPWTPLFSTVSAVVADTGGVLSHCAIVSREYRLPCVVSTVVGTSVIKDGMTLTVDGSRGIVRIDSR